MSWIWSEPVDVLFGLGLGRLRRTSAREIGEFRPDDDDAEMALMILEL